MSFLFVVILGVTSPVLGKRAEAGNIHVKIAEQARGFMPESLRRVLWRNQVGLEAGANSVSMHEFLSAEGRLLLEKKVLEKAKLIVQLLSSNPRFSDVSREFGALAPMMVYMNLPTREDFSEDDLRSLLRHILQYEAKFRLVVYEDGRATDIVQKLPELLQQIRLRRAHLTRRFYKAYPSGLNEYSSDDFPPRSPLFGIASLVYSHSINDLAKVWLSAWKSANGDMSGRPWSTQSVVETGVSP